MGNADRLIAELLIENGINLLRFGSGVRAKVIAILQRMEVELTTMLIADKISDASRARSSSILQEASKVIGSYYSEINAVVSVKTTGAANAAASAVDAAISKVIRVAINTVMPTQGLLEAMASDVLIHGAPSSLWWERQSGDTSFRFSNEVRQGMAQGQTTSEIVSRIVGKRDTAGVMDISRRSATALVHASVQTVANTARRMTFEANKEIVDGLQQVSTLDGRTTDICIAYSGAMWDMNYEPMGDTTLPYGSGCPRHWNAIPEGSLIMTSKGAVPIELVDVGDLVVTHKGRFRPVTATMRKPCDNGVVRVLNMGAGRVLRVTDEHPVLTAGRGWVRADAVRCGDQLFQYPTESIPVGALRVAVIATDNYPSCFNESEVFTHISLSPRSMSCSVKLDNDAIRKEGKITDPMFIENELAHKIDSGCSKYFSKFSLAFGIVNNLPSLNIKSGAKTCLRKMRRVICEHARRVTSVMMVRFFGKPECPMVLPLGSSKALGFSNAHQGRCSAVTQGNSMTATPTVKGCLTNALLPLDLANGLPIGEMLNVNECRHISAVSEVDHWYLLTVIDTGIVDHIKDVFNLSVMDDETYISDGFVVHNCRSLEIPVLKSFESMGINLPEFPMSTRASKDGQVSANMTFKEFLDGKSEAFQDELLGKGRAQLYRDKIITLQQLLDQSGNPLTLAQLTAKYAR